MYKLLYYLKRVYVGGFSYDMLLECQKYSGFPGTGCKPLINCNTHHSPSSALLLCVHTRYNLFAHSSCTSLVILIFIKSTVDCIAHLVHCTFYSLFYFIVFLLIFLSYSYLYLNMLLCYVSSFIFIFLHCPLSGPVLTYISLLIVPCMIVYVTNKQEP